MVPELLTAQRASVRKDRIMSAALKNIPATEGARKAAPEVSRPVTDLRNEPAS